jgi:hypothetical protein
MTVVKSGSMKEKGGSKYVVPEGTVWARFVGYVEQGEHEGTFVEGGVKQTKVTKRASLVFEDLVPAHTIETKDGKVTPLLHVTLTVSSHPRSRMERLFQKMNTTKNADCMTDLLGMAYLIDVKHTKVGETVFANVIEDSLREPATIDMITGAKTPMNVPKETRELFAYVWEPQGISDKVYLDSFLQLNDRYKERIEKSLGYGVSRLKRLREAAALNDEDLLSALDMV